MAGEGRGVRRGRGKDFPFLPVAQCRFCPIEQCVLIFRKWVRKFRGSRVGGSWAHGDRFPWN